MRQSKLFTKTRKEAPKDEISKNAELLIRAGYIYKEMAGVYAYLPLGLRVVEKIKQVVREEMNALGGQEIIMTALQRKELWEKTDRWDDKIVDVWFKSALHSGGEVGFGWSHEEPITDMMRMYVSSYRDLPQYVYQFQTKLRNELRAKSGIMRGREFVMKDMYSYTTSDEAHDTFYNSVKEAYRRCYERLGLGDRTYITFAPGGAFTKFSHEFQTVTDAGEDVIYIHEATNRAFNEEILTDELLKVEGLTRDELVRAKAAEVGNIFSFGADKSEKLGLRFRDESGVEKPVILGSYGFGITRIMGVLAEVFSDDKGLVWPESVAPFRFHLVELSGGDALIRDVAERVYRDATNVGIEVLYDDRDIRAGEKLADADLIGIPTRIIIGKKAGEGLGEVSNRKTRETSEKPIDTLFTT